jgi:nucleotide-binding universal stress UspA family protein
VSEIGDLPFVQNLFHPTDFSPESESAFVHALAIAVIRKAELTLLHAGERYLEGDEWTKFPHVEATLQRWNLLEPGGSAKEIFQKLGVRVNKVSVTGTPVEAAMEYLDDNPADLMVVATEGRHGLPRWIRQSTAEQLAEASGLSTLFVPERGRGFVSREGDLTVRRILVPVARKPDPSEALVYAGRASVLAAGEPVELIALHVGDEMPPLDLPPAEGCTWSTELRQGDPVEQIVGFAEEREVDAIFMATDGRNSLAEAIKGSHTEQVVRQAPCPVAAVPES